MEFFAVGRGKYKLCLCLSISVASIGAFYTKSPFYFSFIGSVVYFAYFLLAMRLVGPSSAA
jgi:hypothetical protein